MLVAAGLSVFVFLCCVMFVFTGKLEMHSDLWSSDHSYQCCIYTVCTSKDYEFHCEDLCSELVQSSH